MNLTERLKNIPVANMTGTTVLEASPVSNSIVQKINNSYDAPKKELILQALTVNGFEKLMTPTDEELVYVASVFQSKKFHLMDSVTFNAVSDIGRQEFQDLNNKLSVFTSKMSAVQTPGLFTLIDTLQRDINSADLEGIWNKTANAKPTIMARIKSLFNPSAESESLNAQFKLLYSNLTEKGKGLEVKIRDIETKLIKQKAQQERNIQDLESSYDIYFNSFVQLRKQFVLIVYLEESFKQQLENFKSTNVNTDDLTFNKKLKDFEIIFEDIQNRRLLLHSALLKLPITVQQNTQLVLVCRNLLKEIDITTQSSFPAIRSNFASLGIALNAQQSMLGTESAKKLERQSQEMAMKVIGDLAVKSVTLASDSRLQEAESIKKLVTGLKEMDERLQIAKQDSQANLAQATDILEEATSELKLILGK